MSLREDLALERLAVVSLEAEASRLWRVREYWLARQVRAEAIDARRHVDRLEKTQSERSAR